MGWKIDSINTFSYLSKLKYVAVSINLTRFDINANFVLPLGSLVSDFKNLLNVSLKRTYPHLPENFVV